MRARSGCAGVLLICAAVAAADESGDRAALYARSVHPEGLFTDSGDVGAVRSKGTHDYDAEAQAYLLSGSGANMWFAEDEFFFAWLELTGDFILSADAGLQGDGVDPHRKAGLMARASLASDAAYVDVALHGDGLASLQFRRTAGADTGETVSPVRAPGVMQLERSGDRWTMAVAAKGEPLTRTVLEGLPLGETLYVGLFVCAHNADAVERARFTNVRLSIPAPKDFRPYQDYYPSRLEIMEVATGHRRVLHTEPDAMQAPNWTPDGRALVYNRNGRLYRFDLATGAIAAIDTAFADRNNNDHAISFDGRQLAISHHSAEHDGESIVYTVPVEGGVPELVTSRGPSYLHGWSPDGRWLVYTGGRDGNYDIYKIRAAGGADEVRLTEHAALDDGAEFAPDGRTIWFNSARSGRMQLWRMAADGTDETQVSDDGFNNWFPHVSPDGRTVVYLAYGADVAADDHPWYRHVYLMRRPAGADKPWVVANLYGGQGTINVPSWSPDGKFVAFVSN
ncbi:MAG TPA: hypothetical protein VFY03_06265 [Woeseiaceae bacterium]|nr:hypothetical protein [Woeseiaceae bacterium]